jgi:hypothetical protein
MKCHDDSKLFIAYFELMDSLIPLDELRFRKKPLLIPESKGTREIRLQISSGDKLIKGA